MFGGGWRRLNVRYQLLLTRHKSLKTGGHTKSQLVNEGRLVLAVDLNLDACFIGGLICGYSRPSNVTADYTVASGNLPFGCGAQSQVLVKPVLEAYQRRHTHVFVGWTSAEQLYNLWFITWCMHFTNEGLSGAVVCCKLKTMGRWTHFIKLDVRGGCAGMYQEKMWLNALVYHLVQVVQTFSSQVDTEKPPWIPDLYVCTFAHSLRTANHCPE